MHLEVEQHGDRFRKRERVVVDVVMVVLGWS